MKKINFHLPDFFFKFDMNVFFITICPKEAFYEDVKIASVYGAFPPAIWNGGRTIWGYVNQEQMKGILNFYNSHDIEVSYTYTNCLLQNIHLHDTFCNLTLQLANNEMNNVIVASSLLADYINENYPKFHLISSTTIPRETLLEVDFKRYKRVVIPWHMNSDFDYLKAVQNKDAFEILLNDFCRSDCPKRYEHYKINAQCQLSHCDAPVCILPDHLKADPNCSLQEWKKEPSFVTRDKLDRIYKPMGFTNFKIAGRGRSIHLVLEDYLHYMIKPQWIPDVRRLCYQYMGYQ